MNEVIAGVRMTGSSIGGRMTNRDVSAQFQASIVIESQHLGLARISQRMGRDSDVVSVTDSASTASARWSMCLNLPSGSHPGTDGLDLALSRLGRPFAERAGSLAAEGCRVELRVHQLLKGSEWETGLWLSRAALRWLDAAGAAFGLQQRMEVTPGDDTDERSSLRASLIIESESIGVAHISAAVGRAPDRSHERGAVSRWSTRPRTSSRWCIDLDWPSDMRSGIEGLSFALAELDRGVAEGAGALSRSGANVMLDLCQDIHEDTLAHGIRLSRDAISWLATAGAELSLDQYVNGRYITGVLEDTDLASARIVTPEGWAIEAKVERQRIEARWRRA